MWLYLQNVPFFIVLENRPLLTSAWNWIWLQINCCVPANKGGLNKQNTVVYVAIKVMMFSVWGDDFIPSTGTRSANFPFLANVILTSTLSSSRAFNVTSWLQPIPLYVLCGAPQLQSIIAYPPFSICHCITVVVTETAPQRSGWWCLISGWPAGCQIWDVIIAAL